MKLEAVWPFFAGLLAQAVFLLFGEFERSDFPKLLGSCAASIIGFIPGKHERSSFSCQWWTKLNFRQKCLCRRLQTPTPRLKPTTKRRRLQ
jgi:hypothetical protein